MKKLLIPILIVILVGGGAGAYFLIFKSSKPNRQKVESKEQGETVELSEFIVNLSDKLRPHYLKVTLALEVPDAASAEKVKSASPYIRDAMLMTLSKQNYEALLTEDGKKGLREELLLRTQEVMKESGAKVSNILFTSFVMD